MSTSEIPKRSPLVGQLIESLQRGIAEGRWPVGTKLPVEAELMAQFGVSRVTLRQAVQALVHVGLLETIQGNGTHVLAVSEVDAVLGRYLGRKDLRTVLEVRLAVEGETAALAALRATDADIRALEEIINVSRSFLDPVDTYALAALSHRFHRGIVRASGNTALLHVYDAIGVDAQQAFQDLQGPQSPDQFIDEHQGILDAISAHDPNLALQLARNHLLPVIERHAP